MLAPQKNCIILKNQPMTCSVSLLWKLLLMFLPGFQKMQKVFDSPIYYSRVFVLSLVLCSIGSVCFGDVLKMPVCSFEAPTCPTVHAGIKIFESQLIGSLSTGPNLSVIGMIIKHQQFSDRKGSSIECPLPVSVISKKMPGERRNQPSNDAGRHKPQDLGDLFFHNFVLPILAGAVGGLIVALCQFWLCERRGSRAVVRPVEPLVRSVVVIVHQKSNEMR